MRNRLTSLVLLGTAWGLSSAVHGAEQPASYAANGNCFCNLPIPTSLNGEIVSTPIGGQSLAQVCERVGTGPALKKTGNDYNFKVYSDMQCGHGPGLEGFSALLSDASIDQQNVGPKWDIESAYANGSLPTKSSSNKDVVASNDGAFKSGDVVQSKSRYIKVPTSSNVATANSRTDESAIEKFRPATPKVAVVTQNDSMAQSAEERSRIEKLPLAIVEPLEGAGSSNTGEALTTQASTISTIKDTTSVAQDDSALISEEVKTVAEVIARPSVNVDTAATTAIRVPVALSARSRQFEYIAVAPTSYDFGGAGVQFSASSLHGENYSVQVRAGLAEDYQEALVGATYLLSPGYSDRLTIGLSGGLESGRFNLQAGNVSTDSTSTGVFARAQTIFEVSSRFELQGGVGYSGFFEGDPHVFGAALFHMTQKLDFIGEFEVGDNDSAGLGIRYYYR